MIKKYVYESPDSDEAATILYNDVANVIILHKDSQKMDIIIEKHATYTAINGNKITRLHRDKSTNLVKKFRKEIIERGMKDGICKAM